jgi:hypothetical protein
MKSLTVPCFQCINQVSSYVAVRVVTDRQIDRQTDRHTERLR